MSEPKAQRPTHPLVVRASMALSPTMVRVIFAGDAVRDFPDSAVPALGFTDTYVKLRFGEAVRAYTLRSVNREAAELVIDFVVHGDSGLAGPWAAAAAVGDEIEFVGPGGEWAPRADADSHLFVGDEAALPAIGSSLDALLGERPHARALVFAEVEAPGYEYPLAKGPGVDVRWTYRRDAPYGERLVAAVLSEPWPGGDVEAFVHGNADMVRPLRRYLLKERGVPREHLSISGYWRAGLTDEGWRAEKRDFNAAMEAESGA